jgi:hypothetical protein
MVNHLLPWMKCTAKLGKNTKRCIVSLIHVTTCMKEHQEAHR